MTASLYAEPDSRHRYRDFAIEEEGQRLTARRPAEGARTRHGSQFDRFVDLVEHSTFSEREARTPEGRCPVRTRYRVESYISTLPAAVMRILITNVQLDHRTGTEIVAATSAPV